MSLILSVWLATAKEQLIVYNKIFKTKSVQVSLRRADISILIFKQRGPFEC